MFFRFCSNKEFERKHWCTIWEIELSMQAVILSEPMEILAMSQEDIKSKTIELMKMRSIGIDTEKNIENGWVSNFLTEELKYVTKFLQSHKDILFQKKVAKELLLNEKFLECTKLAPEFIEYIRQQAENDRMPIEDTKG